MVNWDYSISFFSEESKSEIYNTLFEIGYKGKPPDRRFQNEKISLRKQENGKIFHLTIKNTKSRLHFQLHQDVGKTGYHKAVNGGNIVYEEKNKIIKLLKTKNS